LGRRTAGAGLAEHPDRAPRPGLDRGGAHRRTRTQQAAAGRAAPGAARDVRVRLDQSLIRGTAPKRVPAVVTGSRDGRRTPSSTSGGRERATRTAAETE